MKRFHVHVAVNNLKQSTAFYANLFGTPPSVEKPDYAKWMLDDPRVNFAISERMDRAGINHLGIQAETDAELGDIHARLQAADAQITSEKSANCCYAKSDKHWVEDPSGIAWESFRSLESIPFYGQQFHQGKDGEPGKAEAGGRTACCPASIVGEKASATACCKV